MTIIEARVLLSRAFTYEECPKFRQDEMINSSSRYNTKSYENLNSVDAEELGYQIFKWRMQV